MKSKITAALLAFFLGAFAADQFYLRRKAETVVVSIISTSRVGDGIGGFHPVSDHGRCRIQPEVQLEVADA